MAALTTAPSQVPTREEQVEEPMTCAYCPFGAYRELREGKALCLESGDFVRFDEPMCKRAIVKRVVADDLKLSTSAALRDCLAAHGVVLHGLCF